MKLVEVGVYVHSHVAHTPEIETGKYQAASQHFWIIKMATLPVKDRMNARIGKTIEDYRRYAHSFKIFC